MKRLFFLLILVVDASACASGGGYAPMGYLVVEDCGFRYCYTPYYDATVSRQPARASVLAVDRRRETILVDRGPGFSSGPAMRTGDVSGTYASSSASVERMSISQSAPRPEPVAVSPRDPH
jgi:hypothetical protein